MFRSLKIILWSVLTLLTLIIGIINSPVACCIGLDDSCNDCFVAKYLPAEWRAKTMVSGTPFSVYFPYQRYSVYA